MYCIQTVQFKIVYLFLAGKRVLVVGAGPCGLRMAIEAQLLGMVRLFFYEYTAYFT